MLHAGQACGVVRPGKPSVKNPTVRMRFQDGQELSVVPSLLEHFTKASKARPVPMPLHPVVEALRERGSYRTLLHLASAELNPDADESTRIGTRAQALKMVRSHLKAYPQDADLMQVVGELLDVVWREAHLRFDRRARQQRTPEAAPLRPQDLLHVMAIHLSRLQRQEANLIAAAIDLEKGQAIERLPDRKATTVISWLSQHPEIEVISRDRSAEDERARREGAPQAVQNLDRWDGLKNVREALERQLKRSQQTLDDIAQTFVSVAPPRRSHQEEAARRARDERRCAEVAQIKMLVAQGQSAAQIARDLRRSHHFIRLSLRVEQVLETRHPPGRSRLDPDQDRLWERWNAGERNAMALRRQVQQEGFPGGDKAVHQWTLSRRLEEAEQPERQFERGAVGRKSKWRRADFRAGQVVWLLLQDEHRLKPVEWELLNVLLEECPPVGQMRC